MYLSPSAYDMYNETKGAFLQTILIVDNKFYQHERYVFDILSLLNNLGGTTEIIIIIFGIIVHPIAWHSFIIKSIKLLYKV